jgi:hypothetical protein
MSRAGLRFSANSSFATVFSDAREFGSFSLLKGSPPHVFIPNSAQYYAVRDAISRNTFERISDSPFPTAIVNTGGTSGYAELKPRGFEERQFLSPEQAAEFAEVMWSAARKLSDADADILDLLFAVWMDKANTVLDSATVSVSQLLSMRGLKPKRGAGGRKSGYRENQVAAVCESLERVQSVWVTLSQRGIYSANKNGVKIRTQNINAQSRAVVITDRITREHADGRVGLLAVTFRPGEVLSQLVVGLRKQIALLSVKAIRYDPYHQQLEKRLARYLSCPLGPPARETP